ncbi:prolyl oligopeptidase family serine peptidase [Ancylomarina longa]|uniref:prolyl oligopeptidase n=1 Tax=Ancylomarina longa TaxID=2487017 RepID=A0A434AVD5_9BACT|nr:prolyl oligopeptidase family serine peptidase [Ancylomarina longa]RUT78447.1 S9 family peptidase [Ancylomarina longa]
MEKIALLTLTCLMIGACSSPVSKMNYPLTKKVDTLDTYFDTKVQDPYRWLEDDNSTETKEWVIAENNVTNNYLSKIPYRNKIKKRLTALWNYPKVGVPFKKGNLYFHYRNNGLQDQYVLYVQNSLKDTARILLDPNQLSEDGTVALSGIAVSEDSKYLAYRIARSGSDWNELYVRNIKTGEDLNDHLMWLKFTGVAWYQNGFFYSRYNAPEEGGALSNSNEYHKIYYHKLGDSQENDQLIYQNEKYPKRLYGATVTDDQKYLIISEMGASNGNGLYFKDLTKKGSSIQLITDDLQKKHSIIDDVDGKFLMFTNEGAPKNRLVAVDINRPTKENWEEVIPEKENVLHDVNLAGGKIVASYMKDAYSEIEILNLNGKFESKLEMPGIGTVGSFSGKKEDKIAFYSYTSFTTPSIAYKYDFTIGKSEIFYQPKINFDPDDFVTEQKFYTSKDGTKVPMFIVHKKGVKLDGSNPCLLYGYGGFDISLTPYFTPRRMVWLENGGVFALANLRGGGEYGEKWHTAGTKMNKQNVFDDCIAAAEYLIKENYTNPEKLVLKGGSNGGLLVGAVINQRPDLFKVAIPEVGVMDMLRYNKFTIGWSWAGDYGTSSDSKEMFDYLYAYSPIHNITEKIKYPAILVTTADHDDRVVPAHSFKYIATLQEKYHGENPVLIRIESKAGHGGGMPTSKQIEEYTDIWSFIFYNMELTPKFMK